MNEQTNQEEPGQEQYIINQDKLAAFQEQMKLEQNLQFAILVAMGSALIGAAVWAIVTVVTNMQIGWMAVAVGALVGFSVKKYGKGVTPVFGIVGALFALAGCLLGNLFTLVHFSAIHEGVTFFELITNLDPQLTLDAMIDTFHPMDALFYGLAIYEGYKFSFRTISEQEMSILVNTPDSE